jgi:hypothetical protein
MNPSDPFTHRPADLREAESIIAVIQARLDERGLHHRPPPPVPTSCCGRGCAGCVWGGYYEALSCWRADARHLLG